MQGVGSLGEQPPPPHKTPGKPLVPFAMLPGGGVGGAAGLPVGSRSPTVGLQLPANPPPHSGAPPKHATPPLLALTPSPLRGQDPTGEERSPRPLSGAGHCPSLSIRLSMRQRVPNEQECLRSATGWQQD